MRRHPFFVHLNIFFVANMFLSRGISLPIVPHILQKREWQMLAELSIGIL